MDSVKLSAHNFGHHTLDQSKTAEQLLVDIRTLLNIIAARQLVMIELMEKESGNE